MSHPIPSHEYEESKDVRLNALQRSMGKLLKTTAKNMKRPNENHLEYLKRVTKTSALEKRVNAGKGRRLTKKERAFKTKDWPRHKPGDDFFKTSGGRPELPPGYKQADLD